jgi:hypothetical protein
METENKKAKESEKRIVRKEEELLRKYSLLVVFLCHLRCRDDPTMVLSVSPSSEYRIMRMRALLSILMISIAERDPGGRERWVRGDREAWARACEIGELAQGKARGKKMRPKRGGVQEEPVFSVEETGEIAERVRRGAVARLAVEVSVGRARKAEYSLVV